MHGSRTCMAFESVFFDATSPNISLQTQKSVCNYLRFGYTVQRGGMYSNRRMLTLPKWMRNKQTNHTKTKRNKKTMHINDWKASLSWCIQREKEEKKKSINTHSKLLRFNPIFQRNFIRTASGKMYFDFMWNALNEFYALPRCVCASKQTPPTICAKQINDSEHMRHRDMKNAYIFVR